MYIKNVFFLFFGFLYFWPLNATIFFVFFWFFLYYFVFSNGVSGNLFLQLAMKLS